MNSFRISAWLAVAYCGIFNLEILGFCEIFIDASNGNRAISWPASRNGK
jgi:hypothetical protein